MSKNSSIDFDPLLSVLKPLFGPCGEVVVQQNAVHGPKTITRISSILLQHLSTHDPLKKVALVALKHHASKWHDGSTLAGILVCLLHKMHRTADPPIHPRLFSNVLTWIMQHSKSALQNPDFIVKFEIAVPSITAVLRSVIQSKLQPILDDEQFIVDIVHKLAHVFITLGGRDVENSLNIITNRKLCNHIQTYDGVMIDSEHSVFLLPPNDYHAILISCSLSGDSEEIIPDLKYQSELSTHDMQKVMIKKIMKLISELKYKGADLIICQKVIHPEVKQFLYSSNMFYLERLGDENINRLQRITGYHCISSISCDSLEFNKTPVLLSSQHISRQHARQQKVDLLLSCKIPHQRVHSIEISHWNQHTLNDMKILMKQSLRVLQTVISNPMLLPGAGVWQKKLSYLLKKKSVEENPDVVRKLGASPALFRNLVNSYCDILLKISHCLNPHEDLHSEVISPTLTTFDPNMTWDVSVIQINSINTAIDIVKAVISIGQVIECT